MTINQMRKCRGLSLGIFLLVAFSVAMIAAVIQSTFGPVREEICTDPSPEEVANATKINETFSSPLVGEFKARPTCKVITR